MATQSILPAAPVARASDDEILGLNTNNMRKANRVLPAVKKVGEPHANVDSLLDETEFPADLQSANNRAGGTKLDPDGEESNSTGDAGQEELNAVLQAHPELNDAWRDAQAYREVFATPAEAQNAAS